MDIFFHFRKLKTEQKNDRPKTVEAGSNTNKQTKNFAENKKRTNCCHIFYEWIVSLIVMLRMPHASSIL